MKDTNKLKKASKKSTVFCALIMVVSIVGISSGSWSANIPNGSQQAITETSQSNPEIAGPPPVYISMKSLSKIIKTGEPAEIEVRIEKKENTIIKSSVYPQPWGDWVIVANQAGEFSRNPKTGILERTDHLKIMTYMDGQVEIPALRIKFIDSDKPEAEFISAPLTIEVKPQVDKQGKLKLAFMDIKGPIWMVSIWQILMALGILIVVLLGIFWIYKIKNKEKIEKVSEPARPPEEIAREQLERLKTLNFIEQGLFKAYYIELTDILRRYLEGRYSISALDRTTPELTKELKNLLDRHDQAMVREFLDRSDMIKFAKASPETKEIDLDWTMIRDFVEKTTVIYMERLSEDKLRQKSKMENKQGGQP